ncbi:subtilisin (plasmid) [Azospirillum humicireducens]|uniref:Subtilisin n=1 Tax=Azospirillum humicireducens TaxID=1226968 RepID=A0A2R4VQ36_9PROT|nr:S8 family serine peptidase [Azospirillum humicireducens]AWB06553.1 subtilisin [Azospirillum humicireducens]
MRIAVIDSGITLPGVPVAERAAFLLNADALDIEQVPSQPDRIGHGSAVAAAIMVQAPTAELIDAQIFHDRITASPAAVAAALRWAVGHGARLATLSLGLSADRPVLRTAVEEALSHGLLLVAASPARGGPVWPAAYPGVIAATGDARCGPGEVSVLPAAFGACPRRPDGDPRAGGASLAVGHLAGLLAAAAPPSYEAALAHLHGAARWHGPERRWM